MAISKQLYTLLKSYLEAATSEKPHYSITVSGLCLHCSIDTKVISELKNLLKYTHPFGKENYIV